MVNPLFNFIGGVVRNRRPSTFIVRGAFCLKLNPFSLRASGSLLHSPALISACDLIAIHSSGSGRWVIIR